MKVTSGNSHSKTIHIALDFFPVSRQQWVFALHIPECHIYDIHVYRISSGLFIPVSNLANSLIKNHNKCVHKFSHMYNNNVLYEFDLLDIKTDGQ